MMPTWDVLIKTTGQLICLSLQCDWVLGAAPQACQFWTEGEATLSLCCLPFLARIHLTASWNWIIPSSTQIKKAQISKNSVCPYFCENKHDGVRLYEESPFLYTTAEPIGLLDLTGLLFTDWPGLPGKAGKVKKEASGTVHPSSGRRRKKNQSSATSPHLNHFWLSVDFNWCLPLTSAGISDHSTMTAISMNAWIHRNWPKFMAAFVKQTNETLVTSAFFRVYVLSP